MTITFQLATLSLLVDDQVSPEPVRLDVDGIEGVGTGLGYHDTSRIKGIHADRKRDLIIRTYHNAYIVTHLASGYGMSTPLYREQDARTVINEMVQLGLDWTMSREEVERHPLFKDAGRLLHDLTERFEREEEEASEEQAVFSTPQN